MTSRIALRTAQLTKFMKIAKIDSQRDLADKIGVAESTVYRIFEGRMAPGERFIAGLLAAFPDLEFADLFEVVNEAA